MDTSKVIETFVNTLKAGGVVLGPSDTCYGLYCDATNKEAIQKVFRIKQRDKGKPVSMIVADRAMAEQYVKWDDQVEEMWDNYVPGPYTLVVPKLEDINIPVSLDYRIGIRVPKNPLLIEVVKKFGGPIVATSANTSGEPVHYDFEGVKKDIGIGDIDYIYSKESVPKTPQSTLIIWHREKTKIQKRN